MLGEPLHTHLLSLLAAGTAVAALVVALAALGLRRARSEPPDTPHLRRLAGHGAGPGPCPPEPLTALREEPAAARQSCANHERLLLMLPECTKQLVNVWLPEAQIPSVAVRQVKSLLDPSLVALFLCEPGTGVLKLATGFGLPEAACAAGGRPAETIDSMVGLAAELKVLVDESTCQFVQPRRPSHADGLPDLGVELAVPILSHQELLGVVAIGGSRQPTDYQRWLLTLLAELTAVALITARSRHEIRREATTDPLTGLFNRKYLMERLAADLRRAEAYGSPLSVIVMDVDHFKHYNDRNGHLAGDACLKAVARITQERLRGGNFAARYGGEEFIVVAVNADLAQGLACAEQIRAAIASADIPGAAAQPLGCVSISAGVASFPTHGRTVADLIEAADAALYRSKQAGRNRVTKASSDFLSGAREEPIRGTALLLDSRAAGVLVGRRD